MYIKVDGNKAEIIEAVEHKTYSPLSCHASLDRMCDEFEDWHKYKAIHKETGVSEFERISNQEYQHMLYAAKDFFTGVKEHTTPEQKSELMNLIMELAKS